MTVVRGDLMGLIAVRAANPFLRFADRISRCAGPVLRCADPTERDFEVLKPGVDLALPCNPRLTHVFEQTRQNLLQRV